MAKRQHPQEIADNEALMNADHFLVSWRLGVCRYEVIRAESLPEAEAMGRPGKRGMLYVVDKNGLDRPLWNV